MWRVAACWEYFNLLLCSPLFTVLIFGQSGTMATRRFWIDTEYIFEILESTISACRPLRTSLCRCNILNSKRNFTSVLTMKFDCTFYLQFRYTSYPWNCGPTQCVNKSGARLINFASICAIHTQCEKCMGAASIYLKRRSKAVWTDKDPGTIKSVALAAYTGRGEIRAP